MPPCPATDQQFRSGCTAFQADHRRRLYRTRAEYADRAGDRRIRGDLPERFRIDARPVSQSPPVGRVTEQDRAW